MLHDSTEEDSKSGIQKILPCIILYPKKLFLIFFHESEVFQKIENCIDEFCSNLKDELYLKLIKEYKAFYFEVCKALLESYRSDKNLQKKSILDAIQQVFDNLSLLTAVKRDNAEATIIPIIDKSIKKLKKDVELLVEDFRKNPQSHIDQQSVDLDGDKPLETKDQMPSFKENVGCKEEDKKREFRNLFESYRSDPEKHIDWSILPRNYFERDKKRAKKKK
jgi:hypothetical protein